MADHSFAFAVTGALLATLMLLAHGNPILPSSALGKQVHESREPAPTDSSPLGPGIEAEPSVSDVNATSDSSAEDSPDHPLSGELTPPETSQPGEATTTSRSVSATSAPQSPPFLRVRRQGHYGPSADGPEDDWSDMLHALYTRYFRDGPLAPAA